MVNIKPGWRALMLPTAHEVGKEAERVAAACLSVVTDPPQAASLDREVGGWTICQYEPGGGGRPAELTLCCGRHPASLNAGDLWRVTTERRSYGWVVVGAAVALGWGWLAKLHPAERMESSDEVVSTVWDIAEAWRLR